MSQDFSIVVGGVRLWGYVWCANSGAWFVSGVVGMNDAYSSKSAALEAVRARADRS